jgi:excisionase family DNA binding protein
MALGDQIILTTIPLDNLITSLIQELTPILRDSISTQLAFVGTIDKHTNITEEREKLLSRKEAAAYLGISAPTLSEYVNTGKVRGYNLGAKCVRFKKEDLDACLEEIVVRKK